MTKSVVEKSDLSRSRRKEAQTCLENGPAKRNQRLLTSSPTSFQTCSKANVLIRVAQKGADKEKIARTVIAEPELLATVMAGLEAEKAAVRFGCAGVLLALSEFIELIPEPEPVWRFVRKQLQNTRPGTRKKAEHFLKKHGKAQP